MSYNYYGTRPLRLQGEMITRTDSCSTSSTATEDDRVGAGRTLDKWIQRVGRRFESLLNKWANQRGMGPVPLAQEIRRLSKHSKYMVYPDLRQLSLPPRQVSRSEMRALRKRCNKLLKFVGSRELSTQLDALDEVTKLAIDDSLIRTIFSECGLGYLEPRYKGMDLQSRSIKALAATEEIATHELWSSIYSSSSHMWDSSSCESLIFGTDINIRHRDAYTKLIEKSLRNAACEARINVEWQTLSECIHRADWTLQKESLKLIGDVCRMFVACYSEDSVLKDIILRWPAWHIPRRGKISFPNRTGGPETSDLEMVVEELKISSSYILDFLSMITDSMDIDRHLCAFDFSYWHNTSRAMEVLAKNTDDRRALSEKLAATGGAVNRYCRLAMFFDENFKSRPLFPSDSEVMNQMNDACFHTAMSISNESRDAFLIRITVGGVCQIVNEHRFYNGISSFHKMINEIARAFRIYHDRSICLDILHFDPKEVIRIKIDEKFTFDAIYHFPILSGHDESGRSLYIAGVHTRLTSFLTRVRDGSSSAVFVDEHGVSHSSDAFEVLALRFDPIDYRGVGTCRRAEGAMDPTGPLHWRRLWPAEVPCIKSSMHPIIYGELKKELTPLFEECAEEAGWGVIYKEESDNIAHETEKPPNSVENLQYFRALPFAKNRTVVPVLSKGEETIGAASHVEPIISTDETDGITPTCCELDVLSDPAAMSEAINEDYFASGDPNVVLEPLSETLESRRGPGDASHVAKSRPERSSMHDDSASSAKAAEGAHEGDIEYWKRKFLSSQKENAALRARLHNAHL
ncbi:hypothetical protein SCHPADRAFT_897102 [Schizopora paradoxa]|uniref:Uncharacterized protein n=1 Tax=Schizopora paradoxa TaxID=27342 RepID=A0A0H2QY78_9AGAM|nr:hypothetical protein SCHPADRAFT_897102 [Schizopora paradoxa]